MEHGLSANRLVVVVGNGPSSGWLTSRLVEDERRRHGTIFIGCNRRGLLLGCSYVAAPDPLEEEQCRAAAILLPPWITIVGSSGEVTVSERIRRFGAGVTAVAVALRMRPGRLLIVGFDAPDDPRSLSGGVLRPAVAARWIAAIGRLIVYARRSGWTGSVAVASDAFHPLEAAAVRRITLDPRLVETELDSCLN